MSIPSSFNGRTADFDSADVGSIPTEGTAEVVEVVTLVPRPETGRFLPGVVVDGQGRGPVAGSVLAGRPKEEFRAQMRALVDEAHVVAHLKAVLDNPKHKHWMRAYEFCVERGYGKEASEQVTSGETTLNVVIRRE